jgi:hypothetical protein
MEPNPSDQDPDPRPFTLVEGRTRARTSRDVGGPAPHPTVRQAPARPSARCQSQAQAPRAAAARVQPAVPRPRQPGPPPVFQLSPGVSTALRSVLAGYDTLAFQFYACAQDTGPDWRSLPRDQLALAARLAVSKLLCPLTFSAPQVPGALMAAAVKAMESLRDADPDITAVALAPQLVPPQQPTGAVYTIRVEVPAILRSVIVSALLTSSGQLLLDAGRQQPIPATLTIPTGMGPAGWLASEQQCSLVVMHSPRCHRLPPEAILDAFRDPSQSHTQVLWAGRAEPSEGGTAVTPIYSEALSQLVSSSLIHVPPRPGQIVLPGVSLGRNMVVALVAGAQALVRSRGFSLALAAAEAEAAPAAPPAATPSTLFVSLARLPNRAGPAVDKEQDPAPAAVTVRPDSFAAAVRSAWGAPSVPRPGPSPPAGGPPPSAEAAAAPPTDPRRARPRDEIPAAVHIAAAAAVAAAASAAAPETAGDSGVAAAAAPVSTAPAATAGASTSAAEAPAGPAEAPAGAAEAGGSGGAPRRSASPAGDRPQKKSCHDRQPSDTDTDMVEAGEFTG